jgi:histidine triad (HIT) family protein
MGLREDNISPVPDCPFCRIVAGAIPAAIVWEDDHCVAFRDINPVAPVHILLIPRKHVESMADCTREDQDLLGHLLIQASEIARDMGLAEQGYRIVLNSGAGAGQSVWHLHLHLLAGRSFAWPPG